MIDVNHSRNLAVRLRAGCLHDHFLVPVLTAGLGLVVLAGRVTAQTFTTLHNFSGGSPTGLILSGKILYGATSDAVFAVSTDGSGFTNLHIFTDGASLSAGLIIAGDTLYGTTYGGTSSNGTVFKVRTDGTGFTNLHDFTVSAPFTNNDGYVLYTNSDGSGPGGLILSNNTLSGTANSGGVWGSGTVFALNTDGTGFTNLHQFTSLTAYQVSTDPARFLNSDGAYPGRLILSGNTLCGTTYGGGSSGDGTGFAVNNDGTGFTTLYDYPRTRILTDVGLSHRGFHSELILSGSALFGAALEQCCSTGPDIGTVFALNTDGSGFRTLYSINAPLHGLILLGGTLYGAIDGYFCGGTCGWNSPSVVFRGNTDGTGFTNLLTFLPNPGFYSSLRVLSLLGDTLYGILQGGSSGSGAVFAVNSDGTSFTVLHCFTAIPPLPSPRTNSDGAFPNSLILSGNMYGTTTGGGIGGSGTIFSISLPPRLTIIPYGANVILSWPTNVAGFDYTGYTLQSTTNLGSSAFWTTNFPAPVVIAGQNTVTNPIIGAQQFYRLIK
jgi:uncharacterized repeat protein (TIGR03803 family)